MKSLGRQGASSPGSPLGLHPGPSGSGGAYFNHRPFAEFDTPTPAAFSHCL